jgi:excisionase family DNA binding protein
MEDLLRPTEVARLLGVSRTWLYDAAKTGRVPSLRIGGPNGPLRFVPADLERWLDQARAAWRPGDSSAATLQRAAAEHEDDLRAAPDDRLGRRGRAPQKRGLQVPVEPLRRRDRRVTQLSLDVDEGLPGR